MPTARGAQAGSGLLGVVRTIPVVALGAALAACGRVHRPSHAEFAAQADAVFCDDLRSAAAVRQVLTDARSVAARLDRAAADPACADTFATVDELTRSPALASSLAASGLSTC